MDLVNVGMVIEEKFREVFRSVKLACKKFSSLRMITCLEQNSDSWIRKLHLLTKRHCESRKRYNSRRLKMTAMGLQAINGGRALCCCYRLAHQCNQPQSQLKSHTNIAYMQAYRPMIALQKHYNGATSNNDFTACFCEGVIAGYDDKI